MRLEIDSNFPIHTALGLLGHGDELVLAPGIYYAGAPLALRSDLKLEGVRILGAGGNVTRIEAPSFTFFNLSDSLIEGVGFECPVTITGDRGGANMHGVTFRNCWFEPPSGSPFAVKMDDSGFKDVAIEMWAFDSCTWGHYANVGLWIDSQNADSVGIRQCRLWGRNVGLLCTKGNFRVEGGVLGGLGNGACAVVLANDEAQSFDRVTFEPQGDTDGVVLGAGRDRDRMAVTFTACQLKAPLGQYALRAHMGGIIELVGCHAGPHGRSSHYIEGAKVRFQYTSPNNTRPLLVSHHVSPNPAAVAEPTTKGDVSLL